MRVVIIVFSPSGHTLKVAEMIKKQCEKHTSSVRLINITKKNEFLFENKRQENLQKEIGEYDLIFIGGPIYAGHMENHILQTVRMLPNPDKQHANLAIPFASYGGAHSSIALQEMGNLLRKKKYKSLLGLKIAAKHTLTNTFSNVINPDKPGEKEEALIIKAVNRIFKILEQGSNLVDQSKSFRYSSLKERIILKIFSQEKIHRKYKTVSVNQDKCIKCKKCIKVCPVNIFDYIENKIKMHKNNNRCILCAECFHNCPTNAIKYPYIEKAKIRLQDGNIPMEKELSAIYPKI